MRNRPPLCCRFEHNLGPAVFAGIAGWENVGQHNVIGFFLLPHLPALVIRACRDGGLPLVCGHG